MKATRDRPVAPWRLGVDVGGTFTDLALVDAEGGSLVFKAPSTPTDPAGGVLAVLELAARSLELDVPDLMHHCELFVHGSTVATNTLLEGSGAAVGLLVTEGFRDALEIRRGLREDQWDHRQPYAAVLVPRQRRLGVRERVDSSGDIVQALDAASVAAALDELEQQGAESLAICLLNSFLDPAHELGCAQLAEQAGWRWVSSSSQVLPVMGEYARTQTTVVNAYLQPIVVPYLRRLDEQLRSLGLRSSMLLLRSNGGAAAVEQSEARPVQLLLSGPAAGVGALEVAERSLGTRDLISMEVGGTSCDVLLMADGEVALQEGVRVAGYDVAVPAIDVHTVGAGGGTVAWVDEAGLLGVGPQGAGAVPGPACYGLGGEEPTVTDAQLVLGRLRSGAYASSLQLDVELARAAIAERIAQPLDLSVEDAASGILRLLDQGLAQAVEHVSLARGRDPSRFTLVAAGGAGPLHGASIARRLGCANLYVPRQAGVFCALGMLNVDVRFDAMRVFFADLLSVDRESVEVCFAELEGEVRQQLERGGFAPERQRLRRRAELRYRGQHTSVVVSLAEAEELSQWRRRFELEHERLYGHTQPDGHVEITMLRAQGTGSIERTRARGDLDLAADETEARRRAPQPVARRPVYLDSVRGFQKIAIYDGDALEAGDRLQGPLILEEPTTTVLIEVGDEVVVDRDLNLQVSIGAQQQEAVR